nr:hypothetical protein [Tanacetum cinerariifolium]
MEMTDKESSAVGTDNRPPMLEESDFESWKIRIEREGDQQTQVTRKKTDEEFTEAENNKGRADIQTTNILSSGLPRHIFNTLNQTKTKKEIWFRANGNESIYDYFVRFHKLINDIKITNMEILVHQRNTKFVNNLPSYWGKHVTIVKNNKYISTVSYVDLYTHLKSYEQHAMKTLSRMNQTSGNVDPLAYMVEETQSSSYTPSQYVPPPPQYAPAPQQAPQSTNDTMLATINQIINMLKSVQQRALGNTGKHVATGSQGNKKGNQEYESVWFKDKALLMEAKKKGTILDAEAEAFLADVEYTVFYAEPLAITTTTAFEVNHEDAYDYDVDEGPHAAAAFMANLMQTGPSTRKDSDVDSAIDDDDNTIPYHQYQLNNEIESVPTDVSSVIPGGISVITILDDFRSQLAGHIKVNEEQSFAIDSLKAELERYKTQVQNLEQSKVKKDLEQLNEKSCKNDKNDLEESYLEELVCLRNTNKVVMELLQSYGQPIQTVPMLSKRPTFPTKDLHKTALGYSNLLYLKIAQLCRPSPYLDDIIVDPVHTPFRVYDSEETLVQAKVSRTKMLERIKDPLYKVSSKPVNYAKINRLYDTFVPQKQLSREQKSRGRAVKVGKITATTQKPTKPRKKPSKKKQVLRDESPESKGELENRQVIRKMRTPRVVVIKEPPSVPVKKTKESSGKLKGIKMLFEVERFDITNTDDESKESDFNDHEMSKKGESVAETGEEETANSEHEEDDTKDDQDEDPPAGPNQGKEIKKRRTGKEAKSLNKSSTPKESTKGKPPSKSSKTSKFAPADQSVKEPELEPWFNEIINAENHHFTFNELMSKLIDFSTYAMNNLKLTKLTSEVLVGILSVLGVTVEKKCGYGYLKEIIVRIADQKLYKFKEGDFPDVHLNKIEDKLPILTQNRLFNLDGDVIVHLGVALRMFTRGIIHHSRVEDVQLGVESYQRKLRVIYKDKKKQKRLMQVDELHKFSNGTLQSVYKTLLHRLKNFRLGYNLNFDVLRKGWTEKD